MGCQLRSEVTALSVHVTCCRDGWLLHRTYIRVAPTVLTTTVTVSALEPVLPVPCASTSFQGPVLAMVNGRKHSCAKLGRNEPPELDSISTQAGRKLFLCLLFHVLRPPIAISSTAVPSCRRRISFLSVNCCSANTGLPVRTGELGKGKTLCGPGRSIK